jgi:predicted transposase/invertase (TIGR01784 family)
MLHMAFVRLPRFNKTEAACRSNRDKLLYVIKNAPQMKKRPKNFTGEIFDELFELAEIAKFTEEERLAYEARMKQIHSHQAMLDCAKNKGVREGEARGKAEGIREGMTQGLAKGKLSAILEMAKAMLADQKPLSEIMRYTGLKRHQLATL